METVKEYGSDEVARQELIGYLQGKPSDQYGKGVFFDLSNTELDKFEKMVGPRLKPFLNIFFHILQIICGNSFRTTPIKNQGATGKPGRPMKDYSKEMIISLLITYIVIIYNTIFIDSISEIDLGIMAALFLHSPQGQSILYDFLHKIGEGEHQLKERELTKFVNKQFNNLSNMPSIIRGLYIQVTSLEKQYDKFEDFKELCHRRFYRDDILKYLKIVSTEKSSRSLKWHDSIIQLGIIGFINGTIRTVDFLWGLDKKIKSAKDSSFVSDINDMVHRYHGKLEEQHSNIFDFGLTFGRRKTKDCFDFFFNTYHEGLKGNKDIKHYGK